MENSPSLCNWGLAFPVDGGNFHVCGINPYTQILLFLSNLQLKTLVVVDIFVNLCCNGCLRTLYCQVLLHFPLFPHGYSLFLIVCH